MGIPFLVMVVDCGQVQDGAKGLASDAASQAATAAADVVRGQIFSPLQDRQFSAQERQVLSGLLSGAKAAGLPAEFVTPLEEMARGRRPGAGRLGHGIAQGVRPHVRPDAQQ